MRTPIFLTRNRSYSRRSNHPLRTCSEELAQTENSSAFFEKRRYSLTRRSILMQDYIFSDLLKSLRKAKRLSQQTLADKLGVHRNTIWNWEQGVYLPDSRGMAL